MANNCKRLYNDCSIRKAHRCSGCIKKDYTKNLPLNPFSLKLISEMYFKVVHGVMVSLCFKHNDAYQIKQCHFIEIYSNMHIFPS